jgi:glycosyltransferase involved in cell wall biosynthesis
MNREGTPVVACMPAWNAEPFIQRTLDSLAAQTYPHLRVLISDDASTDRTGAMCERLAAIDGRVRVIRQPRRLGWVGNSNFLLDAAQGEGEYAFFAFHDDPVQPTYVERLAEALDRHPHAALAFSDILSRGAVERYVELDGVSDRQERVRRVLRMRGPWWIPNRGLFRLDAARAVEGMRRHLAGEYKADWPWLVALAMRGAFVRVPEPLVHKVWRDESLSALWNRRLRLWPCAAVLLACAREVRRAGPPLGEQLVLYGELARMASGTLRSLLIDGHPRHGRRADRTAAPAGAADLPPIERLRPDA